MHGAGVYASSADATFPAPGGPVPGAGAFVAALHYATGVLAKTAGKPSPAMFEEARVGARHRPLPRRRRSPRLRHRGRRSGRHADGARADRQSATRDDVAAWQGAAPDHVLAGPGDVVPLVLGDDQPVTPSARSARTSP